MSRAPVQEAGVKKTGIRRILAVTGSSGGHIFPAFAFLEELKKKADNDFILVMPENSLKLAQDQVKRYNIKYISVSRLKKGLDPKNLLSILNFFKGSFQSLGLILKFSPDTVVGFGSMCSIPVIFWAWLFGKKSIIHEQNVVLGRANRFLARFAGRIAVSFEESREGLRNYRDKIVFTGNPLREDLRTVERNKAAAFFGFDAEKFTILVMGGSSGSRNINLNFMKAVLRLPEKSSLQIIQLSGEKDLSALESGYKDSGLSFRIFPFLEEMSYAYSASDLVICRAGATTISELMHFRLPAILVPYPYAYKHQLYNAKVLTGRKSALMLEDAELCLGSLEETLAGLIRDRSRIKEMRESYPDREQINSAQLFLEAVLSLN